MFSKFAKNKSATFKSMPEKFDTIIGKNTVIHGSSRASVSMAKWWGTSSPQKRR